MRRAGDKRFDLVLSGEEREAINKLAGREGPQNYIKRLVNQDAKRRRSTVAPLTLRGPGRPPGPSNRSFIPRRILEGPVLPQVTMVRPPRTHEDLEFGDGYFRRKA